MASTHSQRLQSDMRDFMVHPLHYGFQAIFRSKKKIEKVKNFLRILIQILKIRGITYSFKNKILQAFLLSLCDFVHCSSQML